MSDDLKTIKFQMMLSPSDAEAIDDWSFRHRIRSRAEAIRILCRMGMAYDESRDAASPQTKEERQAMINRFSKSYRP